MEELIERYKKTLIIFIIAMIILPIAVKQVIKNEIDNINSTNDMPTQEEFSELIKQNEDNIKEQEQKAIEQQTSSVEQTEQTEQIEQENQEQDEN